MNSIEIEKQIAFHNNDSTVLVRKWSRFKKNRSQNLLYIRKTTTYKKRKTYNRLPRNQISCMTFRVILFYYMLKKVM